MDSNTNTTSLPNHVLYGDFSDDFAVGMVYFVFFLIGLMVLTLVFWCLAFFYTKKLHKRFPDNTCFKKLYYLEQKYGSSPYFGDYELAKVETENTVSNQDTEPETSKPSEEDSNITVFVQSNSGNDSSIN